MSKYEALTAKVEKFTVARTSYWDDLGNVLGQFAGKYREYLGLKVTYWTGSDGEEYQFVSIGKAQGGNFVNCRIFELTPNNSFQLEFVLRVHLQVGSSTRESELVFLPMTVERRNLDYVFRIENFGSSDYSSSTLAELRYRTGDWASLFDDVTSRIESEFELRQFA